MKARGVIISFLAMVVFFASYACANEPEPQTASTAAPVMVPYLNKSISEVNYEYEFVTDGNSAEADGDRDGSVENLDGTYAAAVLKNAGRMEGGEGEMGNENIDMRSDYSEPVPELVEPVTASGDAAGTASGEAEEMVERGGDSSDPVLTYYGCCRITFYDANSCCCGEFANGYTASGEPAIVGWTVANGELPFETMVMIDGQTYCVTDRGVGADEFDILVDTHEEALARGLYYADVYIIN